MPDHRANRRTDTASRLIGASTHKIYQAFVQQAALMSWLPPSGMSGRVLEYDFREGGRYRIELHDMQGMLLSTTRWLYVGSQRRAFWTSCSVRSPMPRGATFWRG
jgi:hypothetical protein